jgi:hypothetical protein
VSSRLRLLDDVVSVSIDMAAALILEDIEEKRLAAMAGIMNPFGMQDDDLAVNKGLD